MKTGLSFDLKTAVSGAGSSGDDALEEYDSVETIETIKSALENEGHEVVLLGGGADFVRNIMTTSVDFVFNIAEGRGQYRSREAQVPGILEMLDIPYSGSDPQTLAVCLDKPLTKKLVHLAGVPTPKWLTIENEEQMGALGRADFRFPAIVKPAYEGSSKGVRLTSLVRSRVQAEEEIIRMLEVYRQPVMIEEFLSGDEITVGVLGNENPEIVGIMRILPRKKTEQFIYSLEVKRDWQNLVDYECPPSLPEKTMQALREQSLVAFKALGCRDFSRVDFRLDADGNPCFIEINPLPGLGSYSDLIIMALKLGWTHQGLIQAVFRAALGRHSQNVCV